MSSRTISIADDAYERLAAEKREGETFSDVVRRLTEGVSLGEYYGVIGDETATDLERVIDRRRTERAEERENRTRRITDALE